MKIFVLVTFLLFSCKTSPDVSLPESEMYFRFRHVKQIYSKEEPGRIISYEIKDAPLTSEEIDTLVVILNELGWEYRVSEDHEVFISKISVGDLYNLSVIEGILKNRMGRSQ